MLSNVALKFQVKILTFNKVLASLSEKRIEICLSKKCRFSCITLKIEKYLI